MSTYDEAFDALTNKQREAVEHIQGPLLVVAGPGTGKTQLLSMRVAQILKTTDTHASSILCLTFTNKAAANMRGRLQQLIGSDALQVCVRTFHSLAAEIMAEYPDYFWNGARLTTAPDAVQTDIITSILKSLPLDNPLAMRFAGSLTGIRDVQDGLKLVKEAGLTPEKLRAMIEANLLYIDAIEPGIVRIFGDRLSHKKLASYHADLEKLPEQSIDEAVAPLVSLSTVMRETLKEAVLADEDTKKTTHVGVWKKRFLQTEQGIKAMHRQRRANEWWLHLADVYEQYRDELHRRGCYDYADMLVEVIAVIEQQPSLRADIQERYQYLMIDEFQDSNAAQMRLAHLIVSNPASEGKPNLMVVGDDDQSIYKFNGAELSNMLGFGRTYPSTKTIVLEDNFRSNQPVLDLSRQVIELASDRLVMRESHLTKNLRAVKERRIKGKREHLAYPTREHQLLAVAERIQTDHNSKQNVAVLARKNESLRQIASELVRAGVPIRYEQQNNILEHEAVHQLVLLIESVYAIQRGDQASLNQTLSQLLGHPMWDIAPRTLWQLAIDNRYQAKWLDSLADHQDEKLQAIANWLMWLAGQANRVKVPVLFDYLIGLRSSPVFTSPFREYYLEVRKPDSGYIEALSAVQKLRSTVQEFVVSGTDASLADFIAFLELHEQNNLRITDESVFVSSDNAVQLLTVHKAKGLEFDTVFIIDAIEKQWQPSSRHRTTPANLPLQPYGDDTDDYVRLMYVALTRARYSIIVTSYKFDGAGEEVVATPLLASALPPKPVPSDSLPDIITTLESSVRWPELASTDARRLLAPILDEFSLNVTGLMNFLDITRGGPGLFVERNLLRLPGARTVSLAFGTAMHSALEFAQRQVNSGEFDLEKVTQRFEQELLREPILPEELTREIPHGRAILTKLFDEQLLVLPEGGTPEQKLAGIDIDGAVIDGKLDHIITDGNHILISDFKTGKPLSSFSSKAKNAQIKIWKHRTQLIFYALLAQNHPLYAGKHITAQMLYLEANQAKDIARLYEPSEQEIDRLAALSRAVYKKIKTYDLPDVSGYSADIDGIQKFEQDLLDNKI